MNHLLKNIVFVISILFLFGCEKVIDFEGRIPSPLLVLNCVVEADSAISVRLTKSEFFLANSYDMPVVENGTIFLSVNDVRKDTLVYKGNGIYKSKLLVKVNDVLKIEAKAPGLSAVQSQTKVQPIVQILSVDTVWERLPKSLWPENMDTIIYDMQNEKIGYKIPGVMNVFVRFRDNDSEQNYFRLLLNSYENYHRLNIDDEPILYRQEFYSSGVFKYDDVVFGNNTNGALQGYAESRPQNSLFSDELFNHKEYTLRFGMSVQRVAYFNSAAIPKTYLSVAINLQRLSREYYFYKKSIQTSQNASPAFSEPVQIYNNIEGGIGVFGSISNSSREIKLDKYRPDMYY